MSTDWIEVRMPSTCPHCGKSNDGHSSNTADSGPEPGDISLCITCGEFSRFDKDMQLHAFTEQERVMIAQDPEANAHMVKAKLAWMMLQARKAGEKPDGPA